MANAIEVHDLSKTYKAKNSKFDNAALSHVDFTIPEGSFYGLLGPNGAGKSTLINILSGITLKTAGNVSICGYDIDTHRRQASSAIGVVPQEIVFDPFFTVKETLEFHSGYYGIKHNSDHINTILEALGLSDKLHLTPRKLSGGMKRRLLIAKALVHAPKILVLDEPTAGVDVELRNQLWDYVRELNKQGTTVLLTTHYLEEAETLCDSIAVINHGKLVANDKKENLLALLDYKRLLVKFTQPLTAVPASLDSFNAKLTPKGDICIEFHTKETSMDTILQALSKAGETIRDLSTEETDLEDIFKHLTQ